MTRRNARIAFLVLLAALVWVNAEGALAATHHHHHPPIVHRSNGRFKRGGKPDDMEGTFR
jgi:hypothetical protein